jgi:hypothetical protein
MSHSLENYATWRPVYDADSPARLASIGLRHVGIYQEASTPNEVIIVWENDRSAADTRPLLNQLLGDTDLQTTMKNGGVKAPPQVWIVD